MATKMKIRIMVWLLITVVGLAVLFASGTLRFGISGPFVYVIYVLAGLLAAFLTFGVLSSQGNIGGRQAGWRIKLGGPIVALVVVAAGGGLYERFLYTPSQFDCLLLLYAKNETIPEPVTGKLSLVVGNHDFSVDLEGNGRALVRGISSSHLGQSFLLRLSSPNYEVVTSSPSVLSKDNHIAIKVKWKRTWERPQEVDANVTIERGHAMNYGPRPDQKILNFRLKVVSRSALPIPLSSDAVVSVLTNDGVPLEKLNIAVVGDRAVIPPKGVVYLHVEGMVPKNVYHRIRSGTMIIVTLAYDSDVEASDVVLQTLPLGLSDANFEDSSK